jgi:hypothetical protein
MSWKKLVFCGSVRRDRSTPLASVISGPTGPAVALTGLAPAVVGSAGLPEAGWTAALVSGLAAGAVHAGLQAERMSSKGASVHLEEFITSVLRARRSMRELGRPAGGRATRAGRGQR